MSILWCGGEDIDFPNGSATFFTGGSQRAGYARIAIAANGARWSLPFAGGAVTTAWFSAQVYAASPLGSQKIFGLGLSTSGSGKGLYIGNASTATKTVLYSYDGTTFTVLATEAGTSIPTSGLFKVDVFLQNYGASATVTVYVNGNSILTFSGNVAVSGVSNLDSAVLGPSSGNFYSSEIIVADEDTRSFGLVTMAPNAAGTTNQWTGAFTNVNPTTINDANADFTNTAAQDQQYNLIDLPSGTFNIKAVKIAARAMHTSGSTATGVQLGVNSGGTVNVGSTQTLTTAFTTYERLMATNPVTSAAWAQSDMNPLQIDIRSA